MANKQTPEQTKRSLYDAAGKADASVQMKEVGGNFERFEIYGVSDFKKGVAIRGIYLGNETRGEDDNGQPRVVHVFANPTTKDKFGMWERPTTKTAFASIQPNTLVDVIYDGQADKHPTDPKKSPPHMFRVLAQAN